MNGIPKSQQANPLLSLMRQPKIYIKLPSNGKYWPENSLKTSPTDEYPVYSMTARDELLLKTPDALLNGQAVIDVIQSCMPDILDAWHTPQIDLDAILIAIRIATYGEIMDSTVTVLDEDAVYPVNLRVLLDQLYQDIGWEDRFEFKENLIFYLKPLNYRQVSKAGIETFETQRIINAINSDNVEIDEKVKIFKDSFNKLTKLTIDVIADSIYRVDTENGSVTNPAFIKEFISNCDRVIFNAIKDHLDIIRKKNEIKPLKVKATQEMIDKGSDEEIEIPIVFDASSFFASGF